MRWEGLSERGQLSIDPNDMREKPWGSWECSKPALRTGGAKVLWQSELGVPGKEGRVAGRPGVQRAGVGAEAGWGL